MIKVTASGRLTKDPVIGTTQSGKAYARFSIASNRFTTEKKTDFIDVIVWDKLAENCGKYLTKGRQVVVSGDLQVDTYEKDGKSFKGYTLSGREVEFMQSDSSTKEEVSKSKDQSIDTLTPTDDDMPF